MSEEITTEIEITLTLAVSARFSPFRKAPSVRGGPPEEPDEPASVEDIQIDQLFYEKSRWVHPAEGPRFRRTTRHPLLDGVDQENPQVKRLLSNLLPLIHEEAAEALLEEMDDA